jgi:DNA-binding LytR/AlgR family response regulator
MKTTAIILEDEAIASRRLKRMLHELYADDLEVIETFQTISELGEYLLKHPHPDLLFQDIMVADGNSFDLFDIVKVNSKIIFVTAYDQFAIKALRNNAIDYLLKPLKKEELSDAIERARLMSQGDHVKLRKELSPYKERFLIRFGNKLHSINTLEIAYVYSEEKLSFFILKNEKRIPSDIPLQQVQEDLDPEQFFRVNRQFIVHIDSIKNMLRYSRSRIKLVIEPLFPQDIIISTETTPKFKSWMDR